MRRTVANADRPLTAKPEARADERAGAVTANAFMRTLEKRSAQAGDGGSELAAHERDRVKKSKPMGVAGKEPKRRGAEDSVGRSAKRAS